MKIPFTNKEIVLRKKPTKEELSNISYYGGSGIFHNKTTPMLLSTVYRCVDLISDSLGVLPLETYMLDSDGFKSAYKQHPVYDILNLEPNENMTRFTFFKTMMASVLLKGNGYAYIERDSKLNPVQLVYIPADMVGIEWVKDTSGISRKRYRVSSFKDLVEPKDMLHFLNFSYDGIIGVSTLTHARNTLGIASDSESHASGFFKSGASMAGILKIEGTRLKQGQKEQIYEEWAKRTDPITGKPNGIVVLEGNQSYQAISISPKDSQLLESRQFNVLDICRFFSVPPEKAYDTSKNSYNSLEASQLHYLTDTVLSVITKFELEINRKIFLPSERGKIKAEFNTSTLLRTDKAAQSTYWGQMFNIGAATPNEIRKENNQPRLEGGDEAFVQVNVQPLQQAVKSEAKES